MQIKAAFREEPMSGICGYAFLFLSVYIISMILQKIYIKRHTISWNTMLLGVRNKTEGDQQDKNSVRLPPIHLVQELLA